MINAQTLKQALLEIFGINEKFLVPLSQGNFVPTVDEEEKIGSWIGYRVLDKKRYTRGYKQGNLFIIPVKVYFRLSFVGPQAEELCEQILGWDDRSDVCKAFSQLCNAQLNYNDRDMWSYPNKNQGFNDMPAWICDMSAQTFYSIEINYSPSDVKGITFNGNLVLPAKEETNGLE